MNVSYLWQAFPFDVDPASTTNPALSILNTMLSTLVCVLAGLASGSAAQSIITDDTYFYGQSPPVYPSPNGTGSGDWATSYTKARALVAKLTLEEKVNLTGGIVPDSSCSGIIPPIERVGFTGLCLSDAGNGVRTTDFASSWAAGISIGAR